MEDKEQKIKLTYETNADAIGEKVDGVNKKLDTTSKETDKVADSQKKATKSTKDLGDGVESLGGPIGGAVSGFKAMLKQMWLLVANPIGAVLVAIAGALALVFKAFTSTNDGADKLEQVLSGLSAVVDVLRDRFLKLVSLDFKGAFSGVGEEIEKEFKAASKLVEMLQQVEDATRDLGVSRAKLNRDLAQSKEIITDETASYADKKKAIEAVKIAEGKQTEQELSNAKKKLAAIAAQNALSGTTGTSDEDLQKQADAQSAVYALQQKSAEDKRAIRKTEIRADKEEQARLKEITAARTAAYKERLSKQKEAQKLEAEEQKKHDDELAALAKEKSDAENNLRKFNEDLADKTEEQKLARQKERALAEIEALKQKGIDVETITRLNAEKFTALEIELAQKRADEKKAKDDEINAKDDEINAKKLEADKQQAEKEIEIAKAKQAQEEAIQDAKIGLAQRGIALIANIFGKSKQAQKAALLASNAVGLAEVAINTQRAVSEDLRVPFGAGLPKVPIDIASGALGAASIIAATAKGLKELGGGNAGSAISASGGAGGLNSPTPQVSFQASSENQIANTIASNNKDLPPIKAFVVGKDVTTQQSLDNNKINSNSI